LVTSAWFTTTLSLPAVTAREKSCQTTSAQNVESAYGTPGALGSRSGPSSALNKPVKTASVSSGWSTAQATPSADCL
jgi:hypothetical protein